jgi:hypothetical protein
MNDQTSLSPANGSTPADPRHPDLDHEPGPSLASSADRDDSCGPTPTGDEGSHQPPGAAPVTANRGRLGSLPAFHAHSVPSAMPAPAVSPLEERLRRLEDALAQVADPKQIENRIAERVAERLASERPIPVAQIAPAPAPQAPSVNIPAGMILDVGKRLFTTTAGMANRATSTPEHSESAVMNGVRRTVLFFDMLTEARAIWCMYTDPRYKMSWAGRLVPLALALFLLTSAFLVPGAQLSVVGTFIDKLADLIPAFIFFKLLSYEARRYRETAPDLPPDLRL